MLATVALLALTVVPRSGIFRNPADGTVLHSPFFDGIIVGILVFFFVPGLIYGVIARSIKNDKDVVKHITKSMSGLAGYIVLVFFAAQFVYFFSYSNVGLVVAIQGAEGLRNVGLTGVGLIVTFAQKYSERSGIGTIISTMLPYTMIFTFAWTLLLVLWFILGLPLGPDGPLHL